MRSLVRLLTYILVLGTVQTLFIDWRTALPSGLMVRHYSIDYSPPVGTPPSHSAFPASTTYLSLQDTIPATQYNINVTALLDSGAKQLIVNTVMITSPMKPVLEYLRADIDSVTFALLSDSIPDLTYYLEYSEAQNDEHVNFVETNRTALRIRGLSPNTQYKVKVFSVFKGTPSVEPLTCDFKTKEMTVTPDKHRKPVKPFQYSQPPEIPTISVTSSSYPPNMVTMMPIQMPLPFTVPAPILNQNNFPHWPNISPTSQLYQQQYLPYQQSLQSSNLQNLTTPNYFANQVFTTTLPTIPAFYGNIGGNGYNEDTNVIVTMPPVVMEKTTTESTTTTTTTTSTMMPFFVSVTEATVPENAAIPEIIESDNSYNVMVNGNIKGEITHPQIIEANVNVPKEEPQKNKLVIPPEEPTQPTAAPEITVNSDQKESEKVNTAAVIDVDNDMPKTEVANKMITVNEKKEELPESKSGAVLIVDNPEDLGYDPETKEKEEKKHDILGDATENDNKISVSKENNQIRLDWEVPESVLCDNFLTNTTVLTLKKPKNLMVASPNTYNHIKLFMGHLVLVRVQCMLEGAVSSVWEAKKLIDFRKPEQVKNLHVKTVLTDDFYLASVVLGVDQPEENNDKYEIVVTWGLGKQAKSVNKLIFGQKMELNISSLDAAKLYTFSVKNVSKEVGVESAPVGIRQITAPVITSTLYPGQISSNAININFDDSAKDYAFDEYELSFSGSAKNITKRLSKTDAKTFTFNKLIPGKTYTFVIYTVYKNVRSRPVIEEITTYPLKARKFYAMVGPGYATLSWEVENVANNDCQFRLEYASTSNSGIQKSQKVKLKDVNSYRFTGLNYDTYYTFTITVLMGKGKAIAESESDMITVGFKSRPTSFPSLKRQGSRELVLNFENDPRIFADTNGVVENFAVIVTQNPELGGDNYDLKSYYDVQDEDVWPAYRTSHSDYNPFKKRGASRMATFVIGEEDCDKRKLNEPYCNGVLRSHVDYYVKVRAYLVTNIAMETEWVNIKGLVDENTHEKSQRRLPCYMYLNGCAKSKAISQRSQSMISLVLLIIYMFI